MRTVLPFPLTLLLLALSIFILACDDESSESPIVLPDIDPCVSALDPDLFPPATVSFKRDIKPLLRQHGCASIYCHGGAHAYNVLNADDILKAGPQAEELNMCAVVRGNPDDSYFIWKLENAPQISGETMPRLRDQLSPSDIAIFRLWITEGAQDN